MKYTDSHLSLKNLNIAGEARFDFFFCIFREVICALKSLHMSEEIYCNVSKPVIVVFFLFSFKSFEEFSILKFGFAMTRSKAFASESFIKTRKLQCTFTSHLLDLTKSYLKWR